MNKITLLLICLLCSVVEASGWNIKEDSLTSERETPVCLMPAIGGGLVLFGSLLEFDHGGRSLGMEYESSFCCKADEVLRFAPAVALVGMKAFGVDSRTEKWGELMVRSAASTAIMGVAVEGSKRLSKRVRPDGSNDRSFPSGHSAAAFLTASLFAKEYGHLSPWYSVGAYGVATSTAMLRRVNDKHWMGDVMVGAGIGILSVELGYALADMFYRDGKRSVATRFSLDESPSFAGLYMEYCLPEAVSGVVDGHQVQTSYGCQAGMEAAWFFSPYVGVGGRFGLRSMVVEIDGVSQDCPLDHVQFTVGPYFSYSVLDGRLLLGAGVRGGYGLYPNSGNESVKLGGRTGWGVASSFSLTYRTRQRIGVSLVGGYESWPSVAAGEGMEYRGWSLGGAVRYSL